jgi:hypothetical protein
MITNMAWGRRSSSSSSTPEPVAFSHKKAQGIRSAIEKMETQQIKFAKQPFEPSELLELFIYPPYRKTLVDAYKLCEPSGATMDMYISVPLPIAMASPSKPRVHFQWHHHNCKDGFYVPFKVGSHRDKPAFVRDDAPEHLKERFNQVCEDMIDIHWRFSQCLSVFYQLNKTKVCKTPAQMRYVWPCIYTLLKKAGFDDEADMVSEPSARAGDAVTVPNELAPLLKPTNDTILRALLLDDMQPNDKLPVGYSLDHSFSRM